MTTTTRPSIDAGASEADAVAAVRAWVDANVPPAWVEAGRRGGPPAVRAVRTRAEYEAWYPVFAASGLVAPTWPVEYAGLDLPMAGNSRRSVCWTTPTTHGWHLRQ